MTERNQTPLAARALSRLRAYAKDNGIAPETIQVAQSHEEVYAAQGVIRLVPSFKVEISAGFGKIKRKNVQGFSSLAALREEIETRRQSFEKERSWLKEARAELEKTVGHGWGLDGAEVTWSDQVSHLYATESCIGCRGSGQIPCAECQSIGTVMCQNCEGRGQELCPHCLGRAFDPVNPEKKCPICEGTRFAPCRFCQGTGKILCPVCQGRRGTPCPDCQGTGFLNQEAKISVGATMSFSLGSTTNLPSGLLRTMDRLGVANLGKGHAEIALEKASADEDSHALRLTAKIPYAEIKMRFGKQEASVSVFGKKERLLGIPFFLDKASEEARAALKKAAAGAAPLEKALGLRLMNEALGLVLSGKKGTNELRRLYPVGLSGPAAEAIMKGLDQALKIATFRYRALSGAAAFLGSCLMFGLFFFSPLYGYLATNIHHGLLRVLEIFILLGAMGASWFFLGSSTRVALKRLFPNARISIAQNIGKTGYGFLGSLVVIYLVFFFIGNRMLGPS